MTTTPENTWPGGYRHAIHQHEHEAWNASHYPGTLQLCARCEEPTGQCEEDSLYATADMDYERPLCKACFEKVRVDAD